MDVYLLQHIHHVEKPAGVPHYDDPRDLDYDSATDDWKLIGIYTSESAAQSAIERLRPLEGFRDEPDCFLISEQTLDEDHWTGGFVTVDAADD